MIGVIVNVAAIIIGALIGSLAKKTIPQRLSDAMTTAVAIVVVYIGFSGFGEGKNTMVLVFSMILGAVIGTLLNLDLKMQGVGQKIEAKFSSGEGKVADAFISSSLVFCVGAMAIVGPLQSGLLQNHEVQYTKAILDFVSSIVFASTLGGIGVMLSAVTVLIYQGSITLLAQVVSPYLTDYVIGEMTCAGSILVFVLGLNLLGLTKIKLMNFVPAIFMPIIVCMFIK